MVVRFYLHQDMHVFLVVAVVTCLFVSVRIREEAARVVTTDHRGVVFVRRQNVFAVTLVSVFDHGEQGFVLIFAVDGPAGVKNLVAAVLRVRLGKHHEFNVGRVTIQLNVVFNQIIDFVFS